MNSTVVLVVVVVVVLFRTWLSDLNDIKWHGGFTSAIVLFYATLSCLLCLLNTLDTISLNLGHFA